MSALPAFADEDAVKHAVLNDLEGADLFVSDPNGPGEVMVTSYMRIDLDDRMVFNLVDSYGDVVGTAEVMVRVNLS